MSEVSTDHLKICVNLLHHAGWRCARCDRAYCYVCDLSLYGDGEDAEIKTIVRYCSDWRCQREQNIENGELVVTVRPDRPEKDEPLAGIVAREVREHVRDKFVPSDLESLNELERVVRRKVATALSVGSSDRDHLIQRLDVLKDYLQERVDAEAWDLVIQTAIQIREVNGQLDVIRLKRGEDDAKTT